MATHAATEIQTPHHNNTTTQPPSRKLHLTAPMPGTLRRSLTAPTTLHEIDEETLTTQPPTPCSPPNLSLSGSKSSKSSSFHSSQSDEHAILGDAQNFEEIGLADDDLLPSPRLSELAAKKLGPAFSTLGNHTANGAAQRAAARVPMAPLGVNNRGPRELTASGGVAKASGARSQFPTSKGQVRYASRVDIFQRQQGGTGPGLLPSGRSVPRGIMSPSTPALGVQTQRQRSVSPHMPRSPSAVPSQHRYSTSALSPRLNVRRTSWQSTTTRKTAQELEMECDEDDGDDVPDGCVLENVPITPRPPTERTPSRPTSRNPSPERPAAASSHGRSKREPRVRSIGNGTPAVPVAQGSLRSPGSPRTPLTRQMSMGQFPLNHDAFPAKPRATSWNAALSELSEEAKALTEALEAHAADEEQAPSRLGNGANTARHSAPSVRRPSFDQRRTKTTLAALPLRRSDPLIDPLPASKEKEAVLSRTRPSWLPPKDPEEERRHLREYERMMARAAEVDQQRAQQEERKGAHRDDTKVALGRIWEEHVLPNWDAVITKRRTRELWWRGISPRSRGVVWARAIGNELGLSQASYEAALKRAKAAEKRVAKTGDGGLGVGGGGGGGGEQGMRQGEAEEDRRFREGLRAIERDVQDAFVELRIFQEGGPLCAVLGDVLVAYAMYRSDVGYVSGTHVCGFSLSFVAPRYEASRFSIRSPVSLSFPTPSSHFTPIPISPSPILCFKAEAAPS